MFGHDVKMQSARELPGNHTLWYMTTLPLIGSQLSVVLFGNVAMEVVPWNIEDMLISLNFIDTFIQKNLSGNFAIS